MPNRPLDCIDGWMSLNASLASGRQSDGTMKVTQEGSIVELYASAYEVTTHALALHRCVAGRRTSPRTVCRRIALKPRGLPSGDLYS
jgi:hypothetical protein